MSSISRILAAAALGAVIVASPSAASAQSSVNFDVGCSGGSLASSGYGGFNWSNSFGCQDWTVASLFLGTGFQYGAVSGTGVGYTIDALPIWFGAASAFDIAGLWLTPGGYQNLDVTLTGYLNGVQTSQTTRTLSGPTSASWIGLDWNVDKVAISMSGGTPSPNIPQIGNQLLIVDDITIGAPQFRTNLNPTVAPEPATLTLLGTGLAGVAGAIRRRRAARAA